MAFFLHGDEVIYPSTPLLIVLDSAPPANASNASFLSIIEVECVGISLLQEEADYEAIVWKWEPWPKEQASR